MKNEELFIKKIGKKVPALLGFWEAKRLFSLAKNSNPNGVIVEIGSHKGGSTIILAKGSKIAQKGKVYAVDPFDRYFPIFLKNIKNAGVDDWIIPIPKTSMEAVRNWEKPISLLFIDGDHRYEYVKADFLLWEKHLLRKGTIAFHDSRRIAIRQKFFHASGNKPHEGTIWVVEENILRSRKFGNIKEVDSLTIAQKLKLKNRNFKESFWDMLKLYWLKILISQLVSRLFSIYLKVDRRIGQIGIFLKRNYPRLYFLIKKFDIKMFFNKIKKII